MQCTLLLYGNEPCSHEAFTLLARLYETSLIISDLVFVEKEKHSF